MQIVNIKHVPLLLCFFLFLACNDDDMDTSTDCSNVIVNRDQYLNSETDLYEIIAVSLQENCLRVTLRYGGGCQNAVATFIDSGDVFESSPVQRNVRVVLSTNEDMCQALLTKDFLFDISELQLPNENTVLLNFLGTNVSYLYAY